MKKHYFLIAVLLITVHLSAQITLTSSTSIPQVGDSYSYIASSNYTFNVSQSGANQTWDFSSASGTSETANIIDLSSSSEPLTYPNANIVSSQAVGEVYISHNSSEYSIEGIFATGVTRIIYTDKQEFLKFPITFNDVFNETFSGTVENISVSQNFDRSGTVEIVADGYGDLILPYTTINDVLRVKVTNIYTDIFMGIPLPTNTEIICLWYDTLNKGHLASTTDLYSNSSLISSRATYISQSDLVLGVDDFNFNDNQISIYPNPANSHFIIRNKFNETLPIDIYDIKGVYIKTVNIGKGETKIDTIGFYSGLYLIKYVKDSQVYTKKLVVK